MTPLARSALAWSGLHHPLVAPLRRAADRLASLPPGPDRDRRRRVLLSACRAAERALDAGDRLLGPASSQSDRRLLEGVRRDLLGPPGDPD